MPIIVHEACLTEKIRTLFSYINQSLPTSIHTFKDKESYEQLLLDLTQKEHKRIYTQYVHGEDLIAFEDYAMNKQVFIDLNAKSRIPEWTDGKYLPRREIVAIDVYKEALQNWELPLVIKPGDELPTAGGYGVMICHNQEDLDKAMARIEKAKSATQTLIIEQYIETVDNYCVQYALHPEKGIVYLGASKQLTNDDVFYSGNINALDIPESVIKAGYDIMKTGVDKGFVGIAGFDFLVDKNKNIYAIDLNFRHNGSTSLLLLDPILSGRYHKFYSYVSRGDQQTFFDVIAKYVQQGVLYPLAYYDGTYYQDEHVASRFAGIWHAESAEAIETIEKAFMQEVGLA